MAGEHPRLEPIDADLVHLLASWFNRGSLELRRIDWRTPALILEKLIKHEAVHEIQGWPDLRRRLESDRRCFAFFHPALTDEPLIFVEVALTRGMATAIQPLIDVSSGRGRIRARHHEPDGPQELRHDAPLYPGRFAVHRERGSGRRTVTDIFAG